MADVDRLMAERYGGEWWLRRAAETTPAEPVGPSLPGAVEDELEARRARGRLAELAQAAKEFDHRHRLTEDQPERITQ